MCCGSFLWRLSEIGGDGFPRSLIMASRRRRRMRGRSSNVRDFSLKTIYMLSLGLRLLGMGVEAG